MLNGKKILVGVTGSIAAYKSALLVRALVKAGADVRVVMTPSACDFITPLTLSVLSGHPVHSTFFKPEDGTWHNHVELGLWADLFVIAPLSATTLSKMVSGNADNLLLATYLSARCPVMVAPAMDLDMWKHPSTQHNIHSLLQYGVRVIQPTVGELASGLVGEGRMEEPEELLRRIESHFQASLPLKDTRVLISAGPTFEPIDPVRFIGNRSSGKMGFALAEMFAQAGAIVTLVAGPSQESVFNPAITRIDVQTASEMHQVLMQEFPSANLVVMAAAVADYTPENPVASKMKKGGEPLFIQLTPTVDILAEMGQQKKPGQILVGFALETDQEEVHALDKLKRKNLDHIVLNSLRETGAGFGVDTNKVTVFSVDGSRFDVPLLPKKEVARLIVEKLVSSL